MSLVSMSLDLEPALNSSLRRVLAGFAEKGTALSSFLEAVCDALQGFLTRTFAILQGAGQLCVYNILPEKLITREGLIMVIS